MARCSPRRRGPGRAGVSPRRSGSYDRGGAGSAACRSKTTRVSVDRRFSRRSKRRAGAIRALITQAGNPVLSVPNGRRLDTALEKLELLVGIYLYVNEPRAMLTTSCRRRGASSTTCTRGVHRARGQKLRQVLAAGGRSLRGKPARVGDPLELATRLALKRGGFSRRTPARAIRAVMRRSGPKACSAAAAPRELVRLSLRKLLRTRTARPRLARAAAARRDQTAKRRIDLAREADADRRAIASRALRRRARRRCASSDATAPQQQFVVCTTAGGW